MHRRWFWLVTVALLPLYLWTMTETSAVRVQVAGDRCTALLRQSAQITRTSTIRCPGLAGGMNGLFFSDILSEPSFDWGPLDWLFPRSAWRSVIYSELGEEGRRIAITVPGQVPGWRRIAGEWRPSAPTAVMRWPAPIAGSYQLEAQLRRPQELAGILLLETDGRRGYAFVTDPGGRRAAWWHWQDGQLGSPITGIPYQKSLLAQSQSLLRRFLRSQQGALLVLLAAWLLIRLGRAFRRLSPRVPTVFSSPRWWPIKPGYAAPAALLIALFLLAAALFIASQVLERMPHVQDSITYLFQAQLLARGRLWAEAPALPAFFAQEFMIVDNGRWFGQYPPGFPLVLVPGVWLGRPWLVNPLLSAATILLLYRLGKALYGGATGLVAALLAVVSPFILFMSGSLMAHPAELFWVTAFMLCWTLALDSQKRRWPLLAGATLGLVLLTRQPTFAAVAFPFFLVMGAGQVLHDRQWRPLLAKTGWLLITFLTLVAALLFYQEALSGSPFREPRLLDRPFDRIGFGSAVGETPNAFRLQKIDEGVTQDWYYDPQQPPRGHTLARGLYNTEQNWNALEHGLFGWLPILTFAFIWLAFLGGRPSRAGWALLAVIAATLTVYIFYWNTGLMYGPRYYYAALPAFLLLTARGIQHAAQWLGRGGRAAIALLLITLIAGNLFLNLPGQITAHRSYNFVSRAERDLIEEAASPPALVFVEQNPLNWWEYGQFFSANTPWLDTPIIYARDLGPGENPRLTAQFPGRRAYLWRPSTQILQPLP